MRRTVFCRQELNRAIGLLFLLGSFVGVPRVTQGQTAASLLDSNFVIISTRTTGAVQADIDHARQSKSGAEVRRDAARSLRDAYDPKIELSKKEIEVIDKKRDLAKKEKRDVDLIALGNEKKATERVKELLERQRDLRDAEWDLAKSEADLASASEAASNLELELMKNRLALADSAGMGSSELSLATMRQAVRELEGRTLTAQKETADKMEGVAQRQKNLAERRLQLFESESNPARGN